MHAGSSEASDLLSMLSIPFLPPLILLSTPWAKRYFSDKIFKRSYGGNAIMCPSELVLERLHGRIGNQRSG